MYMSSKVDGLLHNKLQTRKWRYKTLLYVLMGGSFFHSIASYTTPPDII